MNKLTQATIKATRAHYAANALACIAEAKTGVVRVNDLKDYCAWEMSKHDDALAGKFDHSFTFQQRAWYIQTGSCFPFLSF